MSQITNSITQDEIILELIELLKRNQMREKSNDVFELASCMDGIQEKLEKVIEEINIIKSQFGYMQKNKEEKKNVFFNMMQKVENNCNNMKGQIAEVKESFRKKAKGIIERVKFKGKEVLNHMQEFLEIRQKLEGLRTNVKNSIDVVEHTLTKMDEFGKGMREVN